MMMSNDVLMNLKHINFEGRPCPPRSTHRQPAKQHLPKTPQAGRSSPGIIEQVAAQDDFLSWVLGQANLNPASYKLEPLVRRIPACLRAIKARSIDDARRILQAHPESLIVALNALLIGVTSFFRDAAVFDCLRNQVLPEMARRGGTLRIWSIACSSGAELYSVAILLAEAGLLDRSELLGTDCRADAIAQAGQGLYDEDLLHGLEPDLRERYFRPQGQQWRIVLPPAGRLAWKTANIGDTLEPGPWDLILFRNAAIYMTSGVVGRILENLSGALGPGGALVVGKAERPAIPGLSMLKRSVYRKVVSGDFSHGES